MFDFSKVHTEPINSHFILKRVTDSVVFSHYFGEFELGKVYPSVFRKDRNPSTGFYVGKTGKLIYNDLTTSEKLDCFAFVAKLYNISYGEAIKRIATDFGLLAGTTSVVPSSDVLRGLQVDKETKRQTIIQITPSKWTDNHLSFWREFEITKEELITNEVFPVRNLYINKKRIYNPHNYIRFAYLQRDKENEYLKIYSPADRHMKWVSNIPLNVPFGFDKLPNKSDTLIITKSQKDRIVLKKLFTDVIATQNESESSLPASMQEQFLQSYTKRIIFWDNDPTGVDNCKKFNDKGFGYFNIPKTYYEKFKIKDASDFVAYYGVDALKELFVEKGIL